MSVFKYSNWAKVCLHALEQEHSIYAQSKNKYAQRNQQKEVVFFFLNDFPSSSNFICAKVLGVLFITFLEYNLPFLLLLLILLNVP